MFTHTLLIISLLCAVLDWLAITVWSRWRVLEFIFKPAMMLFLITWFFLQAGFSGPTFWFGLGLILSCIGDVLLLVFSRKILYGLIAFLLAHIAYIICFSPGTPVPGIYPLLFALVIAVATFFVLRPIVAGVEKTGKSRLRYAIIAYGFVISVMLFFAVLTAFRTAWMINAAILIGSGAFLFYISDILLAWNRYVRPLKQGRLMNMSLYHLGQILLALGIVIQFS